MNAPYSQSTIELARARAANRPAWLRAIERAALMAPASRIERLGAGRWRITSARSGAVYITSRAACTCPAGLGGRPCWHRAAAALAELDAAGKRTPVCPSCGAETVETLTPGGERCYECSNPRCQRTLHADTYDRCR